jgi:hypothetical protein
MICIEVSNVSDFGVDLAAGEQHKMSARVKVGGSDFTSTFGRRPAGPEAV